jgi:lipoprotein signal peptidase
LQPLKSAAFNNNDVVDFGAGFSRLQNKKNPLALAKMLRVIPLILQIVVGKECTKFYS